MRRRRLLGLSLAAVAAGGLLWRDFAATMDRARGAIAAAGKPRRLDLPGGALEYAEAGDGPPLLMIHGTGGGYDQGLLFGRRLIAAGWRVIAPSRFGYLGSDFPADAGPEAQADALASLLDRLDIARLAVIGGSAGAIPALAFALRHPHRTAALVALVPATHVPGRPAPAPPGPVAAAIIRWGLRSDALMWAGLRLAPDRMIATLLATDPALVHAAPGEEQARVRAVLAAILPVSLRARGLLNDARWAGAPPDLPLAGIAVPTLAISAEDDRFGTAAAARHIAATVPGARLLVFADGGHLWVGHDAEVAAAIAEFLGAP
ncbi:MAG: alpha/beta fold hydrolase [Rhodobacteraceae bacterium]|nr:alpha/beta fold hydrolase [Paracoccaceae bacterium]